MNGWRKSIGFLKTGISEKWVIIVEKEKETP